MVSRLASQKIRISLVNIGAILTIMALVCQNCGYVMAQSARQGEQGLEANRPIGEIRNELRELRGKIDKSENRLSKLTDENMKLLERQAQLAKSLEGLEEEIEKVMSPLKKVEKQCLIIEKQAEKRQVQAQVDRNINIIQSIQTNLNQMQLQADQLQQRLPPDPGQSASAPPQAPAPRPYEEEPYDPLDEEATSSVEPLSGIPTTAWTGAGPRAIYFIEGYVLEKVPPFISITASGTNSVRNIDINYQGTGGYVIRDFLFTISDGSLQPIRRRIYRTETNTGLPVGLLQEDGPVMMTSSVQRRSELFINEPLVWMPSIGMYDVLRIIYDVPSDPSILPLTFTVRRHN